jgi:tetratricopeptide (TPR) repeat protein
MQQARWRDAALLANALAAMRSDQSVQGTDLRHVTDMLNQRVRQLVEVISKPIPTNETREQRIARAVSLAGLGEYEIAASLVAVDASENLASAMLLAAILQDQKQFDDSNRWYRHALRLAAGIEDADARRENRRMCYDALAYNARELKHYRDAEAVYREAQRVEPADIPYFNLQLGKHYRLGGRPAMAVQHLELAAEQDGKLAQEADSQLRLLRHDTPGCFLGRPLSQPARR